MIKAKKQHRLLGYILGAVIPLLLMGIFYILSSSKATMDAICTGFSTPTLNAMGRFYSRLPFSVMETFIAIAVLAALVFLGKLIFAMIRGKNPRWLILTRYLLVLVAILAWIWNGYCWLWNSGYFGSDFSEKAGLKTEGLSVQELTDAAQFFLDQANALSGSVPRDDRGIFSGTFEDFVQAYDTLYAPLDREFPCLAGQTTQPKGIVFSKFMSITGFTGIFFPFSGETYINTHQPAWGIPSTISHEIAHQRGVHPEEECNFLGIAACIQSDDPSWQYSGYTSGLIHLMNALYRADPDAWKTLRNSFTPELESDWQYNNQYWQSMEGTVSKASDAVYDAFLKVNTQPLGIKSYGKCVDLLVLWLNTSDYSPKH